MPKKLTREEAVDTVGILAKATCPKHPRWAKKRKPTSSCESCWFVWIMKLLSEGTTIDLVH